MIAAVHGAPLSFSQLAYWRLHELGTRPSYRQVASAYTIHGPLDIYALRRSIVSTIRRHDALRTRMVPNGDEPFQEISASPQFEFAVKDLRRLPAACREPEIKREIDDLILCPIDVTVGPMSGVRILQLGQEEHVLIVAMDHMIADMKSLGIFFRDVFATYALELSDTSDTLPAASIQYSQFAEQQRSEQCDVLARNGARLGEYLSECPSLVFPRVMGLQSEAESIWTEVSFGIDGQLKSELRQSCRKMRTTVAMGVLTAYAAVVFRSCRTPSAIIRFLTDGRGSPLLKDAIGFFAWPLYVRVDFSRDHTWMDLLGEVTRQYCKASENADCSYLEAQAQGPPFARSTLFDWIPAPGNMTFAMRNGAQRSLSMQPLPFENPYLKKLAINSDPMVLLFDRGNQIGGKLLFLRDQFASDAMDLFARNFVAFVRLMCERSDARIEELPLLDSERK